MEKPSSTKSAFPFHCLTDSKLQAKKEKGLCYRYDEKWSMGHVYKKELQVLVVNDED